MDSVGIDLVHELIELQGSNRRQSLAARRRRYDRAEAVFAGGGDGRPRSVDAGGCRAEWIVEPSHPAQRVLAYFHGGGYQLGSPRSHHHLARALGKAAGACVLSVEYRLAPEHPFPAAVEDTVMTTRWLARELSGPIVLGGDSAGGGLVIATLLALRDGGDPLPSAAACLSPWVDLTGESASLLSLASRDPLLEREELMTMAAAYLNGADPREPLASPIFASLDGLPPLLIQAGGDEILRDDARSLSRAAKAANVEVTLQEWPDMVHVWQWYFPVLEEGRRAITSIGAFLRQHSPEAQHERHGVGV
jgi:phosphinothricin tripeptide acetyl hydrolase